LHIKYNALVIKPWAILIEGITLSEATFTMRPQTSNQKTSKCGYNTPATSRPEAFVLLGHHDS
jgi:hypothetical protein